MHNSLTPLGPLWGELLRICVNCVLFFYMFVCVLFGVGVRGRKWSSPTGGRGHAILPCLCMFVRVGRRRRGSIFGSIFEPLWGPSSPLYSFFVALVAKTGLKKPTKKCFAFRGAFPSLGPHMPGVQGSPTHGLARG